MTIILATLFIESIVILALAYLTMRFAQLFFYFSKLIVMAFGALLAFQEISIVSNGFLNWLIWFLIIGVILVLICGFPRINQAVETCSEICLAIMVTQLVLQIFDHQIDETVWWIILIRFLIMLYPLPLYYLRKNFTLTRYKYKGSRYDYHLFSPNVKTYFYEEETIQKDLTRGLLNYGDILLPLQRVVSSAVYGFSYAAAIQIMFFTKGSRAEDVIAWILIVVFAVAAYFVDKELLPRIKARMKEEPAEGEIIDAQEAADTAPQGSLLGEQLKAR